MDPASSPTRILFVCLGNICRSPAAEAVMRSVVTKAGLASQIEVSSAGTIGYHVGARPDQRMRAAATSRGYQLESRARKFVPEDFESQDLIITMDEENRNAVLGQAHAASHKAKVWPFCKFCRHHQETEVPDPYYGGPEGFERVLDLLEDGCQGLLDHLELEKAEE